MNQGGLSTFYSQCVDSFGRDGSGCIAVFAKREATLTPKMDGIESRYLREILLVDMWRGPNENVIRLSRDEVLMLRDSLSRVLESTEGDVMSGERGGL